MNPDRDQLNELLEEVVSPRGASNGPSRVRILEMVRTERSRRTRRVVAGTAVIAALAFAAPFLVPPRPVHQHQPQVAHRTPPPPVVIKAITDEELFALLKSTPAALLESPNGDSTLFVVAEQ